jgi:hypothetical protein
MDLVYYKFTYGCFVVVIEVCLCREESYFTFTSNSSSEESSMN